MRNKALIILCLMLSVVDYAYAEFRPAISNQLDYYEGTTTLDPSYVNVTGDTMTGTLNTPNILPTTDDTYNLGSEDYYWQNIYISNAINMKGAMCIPSKVNEVGGIAIGKVVYISGATGNKPQVSLADNTSHDKSHIFGMAIETKANGESICIGVEGEIEGIDTSLYSAGDRLHLTTSGGYQTAIPTSGAHLHVGFVSKSNASTGIIAIYRDQYVHDIRATTDLDVELACGSDDSTRKISFENYSGSELGFIRGDGLLQWEGDSKFNSNLSMETNKIVSLADPANAQDAATKNYHDNNKATPGGSDTYIQFNDGGAFGGDAGLAYNKTSDIMTGAGNWQIIKDTPELKLTDSGDSNYTRWLRTDANAQMTLYNIVNKSGGTGNALDLDGTDDCVEVNAGRITSATTGTIVAWVKQDVETGAGNAIFGYGGGNVATPGYFEFFINSDHARVGQRSDGGGSNNVVRTSGTQSFDGNWRHVALVSNGSAWSIYIDGSSVGLTVVSGSNNGNWIGDTTVAETDSTTIGCLQFDGSNAIFFDGLIDEIAIWDEALSANDISDLYNSGSGLAIDKDDNWPTDGGSMGTNLIGLWHHNENVMNSAPGGKDTLDDSANSNHGVTAGTMTDSDFVTGKVLVAGADTEIQIIKSIDGVTANEGGIAYYGDPDGRTVIEGGTTRFEIASTEIGQIDANGTLTIDNGDSTVQALILKGAASQTENIFETQDSAGNIQHSLDDSGGFVFNEEGNDQDGRMESDGEDKLFYLDAGANQLRFGDADTNYMQIDVDGDMIFTGTARIDWRKVTANSVVLSAGTSANVVADLQTAHDNNIYSVVEAAATPGIQLAVDFVSVTAFNWVNIIATYDGSVAHALGIQVYNWNSTSWDTFAAAQSGIYNATSGQEVIDDHSFFIPSDTNYIGTGGDAGKVRVRFIHPMAGNASHDLYVDLVALYQ